VSTILIAVVIGLVFGVVGAVIVVGSLIAQSPFDDEEDDIAEREGRTP
jgi:hypothetical protein